MFDLISFVETHELFTSLFVCGVAIVVVFCIWGLPRIWGFSHFLRQEWHRREDIPDRLDEICAKLKYQSSRIDKVLNELDSRCQVQACPGLAFLRDEFHALEKEMMTSMVEIRRAVDGTGEEVRQGVYALLDTVRTALFGNREKRDKAD
jgi:hypothetical protein